MSRGPRYHLELLAEVVDDGDGVPPIIKLRKLLKSLLRAHGMRCVSVEEVREQSGVEARRRLGVATNRPARRT